MARHRSAARICIAGPRPSRSPRARAESSRRALDPAFRCFKGAATFPLDRLQERRRRQSRTRRVNRPLPGATSHNPRDAVSTLRHLPSCRSLALSPEQKRSTVQGWTVQTRPVTLFHPRPHRVLDRPSAVHTLQLALNPGNLAITQGL